MSSALLERGHIRSLDGLRGLAILMVLVAHFYPKWLIVDAYPNLTWIMGRIVSPGGYGVELFFVLSGFLITGILLDTRAERGFLVKFYARRTLRIFPLYYGALAAVLFIVPLFVKLDAGAEIIIERQAWLWTYMMNWPTEWVWDGSEIFLLGHFWSLCVEEHFYLFWPVAAALLSRRGVFFATIALVCVGISCRGVTVLLGPEAPDILRWATLQRLDGLAIGAMLATALREPTLKSLVPTGTIYRRLLVFFSLAALGYAMLPRRIHHPVFDVFGETVLVVCFGLVLLGVLRLQPGDRFHGAMNSTTLVTFGKYSYGLYVIHGILRPAFERSFGFQSLPAEHGLAFLWMACYYVLTTGVSLGLAFVSFHGFEKWFLQLKRHFDYARPAASPP
jgi:peptidoglycan/LPS O-acetylase OafA/YrhL